MSAHSESNETTRDDEPQNESNSSDNDFDDDDVLRISDRGSPGYQLKNASMTESYSEIINSPTRSRNSTGDEAGAQSGPYPIPKRRPGSLSTMGKICKISFFQSQSKSCHLKLVFVISAPFPQGTVSVGDGNMMQFVADNLEYKIKVASPVSKKGNLH